MATFKQLPTVPEDKGLRVIVENIKFGTYLVTHGGLYGLFAAEIAKDQLKKLNESKPVRPVLQQAEQHHAIASLQSIFTNALEHHLGKTVDAQRMAGMTESIVQATYTIHKKQGAEIAKQILRDDDQG